MPVIQDPRQNPPNEKNEGIAYFEEAFVIEGITEEFPPGHYFYKKERDNPDDINNSRYYPHGFPVKAVGITGEAPDPADVAEFNQVFCNLNDSTVLLLRCNVNESDLDRRFPMAAFLHRVIAEESVPTPPGRGLKRINPQGRDYRYHRNTGDIGILDP